MAPAIQIENLSKRYIVDHEAKQRGGYRTLRESLVDAASYPLRRLRGQTRATREEFWALKDVSFEVQPGEVVGIIGRNGAGKSTLLKILSQITKPTKGRVTINGRVGSLLEVGTGFHPELSGRENIYLNGSILGMSREEIKRSFDEIVSFSGVETFLDTPVKRYSSGMQVRLAFAVAAHLRPEILIIDEVLAVGDAEFQSKCLDKMRSVSRDGRTVIFVSHNMGALQQLCDRGVLLSHGTLHGDDTINEAVSQYLQQVEHNDGQCLDVRLDRRGTGHNQFRRIKVLGGVDENQHVATGRPAVFVFELKAARPATQCVFTVYDSYGQAIVNFDSGHVSEHDFTCSDAVFKCSIESMMLLPGRYRINAALFYNHELLDHVEGACVFHVESGTLQGRPSRPFSGYGSVTLPHTWQCPTTLV